jgi:hypothetical protein
LQNNLLSEFEREDEEEDEKMNFSFTADGAGMPGGGFGGMNPDNEASMPTT